VRAVIAALACTACQGQPAPPAAGSAAAGAVLGGSDAAPPDDAAADGDTAASAGQAEAREPDRRGAEEDAPPDPGRVIAELGAIPAWQAVVDRAQLLGRRGQHGVVYGRVGPVVLVPAPPPPPPPPPPAPAPLGSGPGSSAGSALRPRTLAVAAPPAPTEPSLVPSPYVWLIDDTEGNGSLGIRIALGDRAHQGDRIAAGGAWQLDAERRWFWKPDAVQPLPPAAPSDLKDPPPPVPGHAIATGPLPSGARTASVARDNDAIYFQIVGPSPTSEGDGWQIADQLGSPTALVLNLPGERASYGGQDMRAPDERWQLRRAQTYWVRIGVLHKHTGKPATVNARTAPVRVP
jgi:hypothetical protein